jgi:amino acid transporter
VTTRRAVGSVGAARAEEPRLRANAVGFFGVLAQSISDVAPSASVALVVPVVFVIAGEGAWVSWLIVTGVMLCVAYCCAEFTRRYATTGGLMGIVAGTGFRTMALAVAGCVVVFALWVSPANVLGTGLLLKNWFSALGVRVGSGLLLASSLAALAIAFYIAYRGIRISAIMMLVIESFTVIVLGILLIVVLAGNKHGSVFDSAQLSLKGVSLHRVLLGSATAIITVASFECSATLGQESREARRNIPRSLPTSILLSCGLLTVASYVMTLGFVGTKVSLATSTDSLSDLSKLYGVSSLRYLLLFGVAFSAFGATVAFANWAARVIFTLAREGLLPKYFAAVNREAETPARAVMALAAIAVVYMVGFVIAGQANLKVWGYMATAGALMYTFAYLLAMLALGAFGRRTLRNWWMLVAAAISAVTFGYVVYSSVDPEPGYPLDLWTWVGVGLSLGACITALALRLARVPAARTFGRTVQTDTGLAAVDEDADRRPG